MRFFLCYSQTAVTQTIEETSSGYTDRDRKREYKKHGGAEGVGGEEECKITDRKKDMHTDVLG